ncbi:hypothetical protein SAMN04489856_1101, partial [Oleiphilus messinensis]
MPIDCNALCRVRAKFCIAVYRLIFVSCVVSDRLSFRVVARF